MSLRVAPWFRYAGASVPTAAVSAAAYFLLMRRLVVPHWADDDDDESKRIPVTVEVKL
jgi:hypothetical protein